MSTVELSQGEHRAITRIGHQLRAIADEATTPDRIHWSHCFDLILRILKAVNDTQSATVEWTFTDEDKAALTALRPKLSRLLFTQWSHGQWKLGELHAWQQVWTLLLELGYDANAEGTE
jgi:hypothetical protein